MSTRQRSRLTQPLATGTLTFLFTDIEGSTKLWEVQPEPMRAALVRHDALLRRCIEASEGRIFKTAGDAFCAAFATAADAVRAALAAQLALRAERWPQLAPILVRMALHTGAAEQRDGDYFGPALNHVARLLVAAHGGQTLLSQTTHELCCDRLPDGAALKSLGEHRLKDLIRPETVFQLCHPGLPEEFPNIRTQLATIGILQLGLGDPSTPDFLPWNPKPLRDLGWIEGRNLVVERRYAGGRAELLKPFADDLVRLKVDIIATNGTDAAIAAQQATTRIPIVMYGAGDPVASGLVASLSHPGGNVTGFSLLQTALRVKRLEVLRELLPTAQRVGELVNPNNPFRIARKEYEEAYGSLGMQPLFVDVEAASDFGNAFAKLRRLRVEALVVPSDGLFIANAVWIMRAAAGQAMPTMVDLRSMVKCGGLVSYTYSAAEEDQCFATFVDKILRGAKPGDLPVEQPTKFELLFNVKTAKMLGVTIPQSMLLRADEVIR